MEDKKQAKKVNLTSFMKATDVADSAVSPGSLKAVKEKIKVSMTAMITKS